jgi:hypothetical protein
MKQRNFPEWARRIVEDMYTGASSTIELRGERSDVIAWKKGVKQGCPLSPLLFNLCIEPLLQLINRGNKGKGAYVKTDTGNIEFIAQAYADDVVLMSQEPEGVQLMLKSLEAFTRWSKMEVNAGKCVTASYLLDGNRHRSSLAEPLRFEGHEIPNLTLDQSLKYLGSPITARRTVKLQAVQSKILEVEILLEKIMKSPLLTVQKIDAVKTFLIPSLDFMMLTGEIGRKQLTRLDKKIRASMDRELKVRGLPVECHHMSWRDGGLSYPSLKDRQDVLTIRSFAQMVLSKDSKVRDAMYAFSESERRCRGIAEVETESNQMFLNWSDECIEKSGTSSIIERARQGVERLKLRMRITEDGMELRKEGLAYKTKKPTGIGRFLTQNIIRKSLAEKVQLHPLHGASFQTLKGNVISNKILRCAKYSNGLFRFVVAGRADCLPTPANVQKWYGREENICRHCGGECKPTLAHILNKCTEYIPLFTRRHNRLSDVVRKAIEEHIGRDLIEPIMENAPIPVEGLSDEVSRQRPDIVILR